MPAIRICHAGARLACRLAGPVLLITGASRGIGAATARLAGQHGFDVAVNFNRSSDAASEVVEDIVKAGGRAVAIQGDMGVEAESDRVFRVVEEQLGPLAGLVYNAAVTGPLSRMDEVSTATIRTVLDLNVFGALLATRNAVRRMSTRHGGQGGSIVLISSVAATLGSPGEYVWYAASKGAIDTLTVGLAREVAGDSVRVNAVAPGSIATEMQAPGRIERMLSSVPMGRPGTPAEIAAAVLFLLSKESSFTTGAILRISGGR